MESSYRGNLTEGTGKSVRVMEVSSYRESTWAQGLTFQRFCYGTFSYTRMLNKIFIYMKFQPKFLIFFAEFEITSVIYIRGLGFEPGGIDEIIFCF